MHALRPLSQRIKPASTPSRYWPRSAPSTKSALLWLRRSTAPRFDRRHQFSGTARRCLSTLTLLISDQKTVYISSSYMKATICDTRLARHMPEGTSTVCACAVPVSASVGCSVRYALAPSRADTAIPSGWQVRRSLSVPPAHHRRASTFSSAIARRSWQLHGVESDGVVFAFAHVDAAEHGVGGVHEARLSFRSGRSPIRRRYPAPTLRGDLPDAPAQQAAVSLSAVHRRHQVRRHHPPDHSSDRGKKSYGTVRTTV